MVLNLFLKMLEELSLDSGYFLGVWLTVTNYYSWLPEMTLLRLFVTRKELYRFDDLSLGF